LAKIFRQHYSLYVLTQQNTTPTVGSGGPRILAKGMPHRYLSACINHFFFLEHEEEIKIMKHEKIIKEKSDFAL
jgi:hypothetical protein